MVEFVVVLGLALAVTLMLVQFGLVLYERNVILTATADGARVGAGLGGTPALAVARAEALVTQALGPLADHVNVRWSAQVQGGVAAVGASARLSSPLPGFPPITVRALATLHQEAGL